MPRNQVGGGAATGLASDVLRSKSQFLYFVDADQLVLDAAAYADEAGLWVGNKATVTMDQFIGAHAETGSLTRTVNLYRTDTGFVHGSPGGVPTE